MPRGLITDYTAYHRAIAEQLRATQDQVRNLIGNRHWQTDGEHKEAILRKTLRSFLPESLNVGRGFVSYRHNPSSQIDILVTTKAMPTLFKDGDLVVVTPDCVRAIIEVKTRQRSDVEWQRTLAKLAEEAANVRGNNGEQRCWAGVFVFEESGEGADPIHESERLLRHLAEATRGDKARAINCLAVGPRIFARYWPNGRAGCCGGQASWHAYVFDQASCDRLAPAYFLSNLIWDVCPGMSDDMMYAWFPIEDRSGKERYRVACERSAGSHPSSLALPGDSGAGKESFRKYCAKLAENGMSASMTNADEAENGVTCD